MLRDYYNHFAVSTGAAPNPADYCNLALGDEENLNELLNANGIWNSEPGEIQYGVTESGLRRLIKTISSISTFRALDRNDQTLLLKRKLANNFLLSLSFKNRLCFDERIFMKK